jgi:hypothetical protein
MGRNDGRMDRNMWGILEGMRRKGYILYPINPRTALVLLYLSCLEVFVGYGLFPCQPTWLVYRALGAVGSFVVFIFLAVDFEGLCFGGKMIPLYWGSCNIYLFFFGHLPAASLASLLNNCTTGCPITLISLMWMVDGSKSSKAIWLKGLNGGWFCPRAPSFQSVVKNRIWSPVTE